MAGRVHQSLAHAALIFAQVYTVFARELRCQQFFLAALFAFELVADALHVLRNLAHVTQPVPELTFFQNGQVDRLP